MEIPKMFGWFHLLSWAIVILAIVLLCVTHKPGDEKRVRRVIFIAALISFILEIYKQIVFNFSYAGETITFDYQWYIFPFQFCSVPIYVGLLTAAFRKGRVHKALCAFLATFAIFAGCTVMFYPVQVFTTTIGINIQTMFCHGSMLVVGFYMLYTNYVKSEHKTILRALPVFAVAIGIAMILNEVVFYNADLVGDCFDMFYISPHYASTLPLYSIVEPMLPYPVALLVYIIGFTLVAYIILLISMGIKKLARAIKKH